MSIYQYIELKNRLLAQQPIPQRTKKRLYFLFSKIAQHKIRETKSFISTVKNEYMPVNSGCYVNLKAQAKKELFANNPIVMFLSQKTDIPILQYAQDRIIKVILKETAQLNNFWLRKLSDIVEIETKYRLCLQNGQHSETGQINKTLVVVK